MSQCAKIMELLKPERNIIKFGLLRCLNAVFSVKTVLLKEVKKIYFDVNN